MKTCPTCKQSKSRGDFHKSKRRSDGLQVECKVCKSQRDKNYHQKNLDKIYTKRKTEENVLKRLAARYNVSVEEIRVIRSRSNGICEICKKREATQVDHCHETGKVRGFLCKRCNIGLGHFSDNRDSLQAAIEYLDAR